jgi:hypothetical protein
MRDFLQAFGKTPKEIVLYARLMVVCLFSGKSSFLGSAAKKKKIK